MNKNPLVLTIDVGTQSLRASLVDKKGNIISLIKNKYDPVYLSPENGQAEQDADFYWNHCVSALKELAKANPGKIENICGATVTTFRDSAVLLDANYKPIRSVILWLDQRMAKAKERLPTLHSLAFKLVGMENTIVLNRKRTMAHWIKENQPDVWLKTKKYVNISTYLIYKLTGRLADSPSGLTGHYPINFKKRKWYKEGALKGRVFGIPSRMLCELVDPCEIISTIKDEVADETGLPRGIKVYASGSDKGCETLGLGALSKDIAAISYGTASTVEVSNKKYHEPEPFLPAYGAVVPNWYNMEVQIYRGYWMIGWFTKEFAAKEALQAEIQSTAVEEVLNHNLASIPPGSDGLVLQPYWGPGLKRPLAKGAIVGFSDIHTREHMYRAIIEGIAYALREGLEGIEKSQKHRVKEIRISGGGSQNDAICQITADIFGLPVYRVQTIEATTLGAATSVFYACGEFQSVEEGMKSMAHITDVFTPDRLANQQYQYLYKHVYLKLFPQLDSVYRNLKRYDNKFKGK